ncbi:ATP-dependent zinc metalloprotease FtsH [Dietzia psychralcaliphila]|uniref:ATP-dependent zinc metalloprotease FtsH n=1 Tax=Dietzia psychralcaliphila TaxID=139021 RepID=A0AAD0JRK1_9ACTN|nr:ATP-dependent zinc metalloprotease FtsH [Dietzia psychralcaliphila]AWH94590.1 cell division protein FtsH [Dietzia psychralcaliphila]PTM86124.1 cell division protease FtsH [Dietzia psychralcaliphila]
MERKSNTVFRNVAIAGVIILAIVGFSFFANDERGYTEVDTSVALAQIDAGNVTEATIEDREQQLRLTLEAPITPEEGADETDQLIAKYPDRAADQIFDRIAAAEPEKYDTTVTQQGFFAQMLSFLLPMLILFGLLFYFMSRMQGGKGGLFGVGKSRAVEFTKDMPQTTFADVAGEDEAVEELNEIKDFLQNPARYERLGAKIPRGVLLYGPPGTGKTLLARAVAGEAGVPFYSISGSDFVEMFVGVGASRVRDLFEKAKQNAPCIVFVDEIDAVGRHRGSGTGGGHDEREQTLNQLLVEMDGFSDRETVIMIAATNRPDVLDPALLRPGRFDRQVPVTNPDLKGREAILAVHSAGKPLAEDVNMTSLARRTIGMSGADLANVLNEGALLAARLGRDEIDIDILEEATDRVVGGPRRKHRVISEHEKKVTAYHESGHALAAWAMEDLEPVHKVTILARGRTGGHALVVPEDDKSLMTRADMIARVVMAMGGRAAEEYVFGEPTSGASSDIEQATRIARTMVAEYGMSAKLGAVKYGGEGGDPFLGRGGSAAGEYSPEVAKIIDDEVRRIIDAAHTEAWLVLESNREILDSVAGELLEKETLRQEDLQRLFADVVKRPRITEFDDFSGRVPSTRPPIKTPGELAKERGEPWPPPVSDPFSMPVLPASRESGGTGQDGVAGQDGSTGQDGHIGQAGGRGPVGRTGPGRESVPAGSSSGIPAYGTPPPPGWSAPGWPPRGTTPGTVRTPDPGQRGGQGPDGNRPQNGTYGPSGSETTRLPAAPAAPETTREEPGHTGDEDTSPTVSDQSTRAWSAVDGDGRRSGSRRREDKEPGWRAPWERDD